MPTDPVVELASQLQAFISTKHPFASELDPEILQSVESLAPPSTSSPAPASSERASRSIARPLNSSPYPVEWAETRTHLRLAVRQFQRLLKHRTASGLTSAAPEAFQSPANHPINSTITEDLAPLISVAQAPETHQVVSQEITTMAASSNSSTDQGTPRLSANKRQEITQMVIDFLDDYERSKIGFFYPNMPLHCGEEDIVEKDGKWYYRNACNFTNQVRLATRTWNDTKVKQLLIDCLRGEAALWWNSQLDVVRRAGYLAMPGIEDLCKALETRFRLPPLETLARYKATRYSIADYRSRRSTTEYVATLEAAAKACGLGSASDDPQKRGLVIQTWMHLDLPLRETVDKPLEDLTLDEFTKVLLRKQNNWFDRYPPHGSRPHQAPYYQPPRHQSEQRHQLALQFQRPQFMPGPNWYPNSARQSPAPVSHPSRYPNQSGPPNSGNNQNTRHSAYPLNTTYQFRSQPYQSLNVPG
jgi:hypothetical protein